MESRLDLQHPLFEIIREEHRHILKLIEDLSENILQSEKMTELWVFAELTHHHKEEIFLFTELAKHPRIREGGPRCTYFFSEHCMHGAPQVAEAELKIKPPMEEHQKDFYARNLPVTIPTDEHRAGKLILRHLIENFETISSEKRQSLLEKYQRIQTMHINKEETCLFHLCMNIMSAAAADSVLVNWRR